MNRAQINAASILVAGPVLYLLVIAFWIFRTAVQLPETTMRILPSAGMAISGALSIAVAAYALACAIDLALMALEASHRAQAARRERSALDFFSRLSSR